MDNRMSFRLAAETRQEVHQIAEEEERADSWVVRKCIDEGLGSVRRQRMTALERYAKVAEVPTLPVQQHVIQRAVLFMATKDGEANIQALALIRGAYGASLEEARDILRSMQTKGAAQ